MRKFTGSAAMVAVAVLAAAGTAAAQTATQSVAFEVQAINMIALSGTPSLTISTAVAGDAPTSVTAAASYAITTNELNRKITASLDSDMASGLTLSINMSAPTGGSSLGSVVLSSASEDVVTGVELLNESGLTIEYQLDATSAAGVVASGSRIVLFTVTAGA